MSINKRRLIPSLDAAGSAGSAALAVPNVAHEALPAARLLGELVLHFLRLAVTRDRFLHLLVDLSKRQSAGALHLVGIVFGHAVVGR